MGRSSMLDGDPKTLVLVGRTGNGKSATGNSILGRKAFKSKSCQDGVTSTCELQKTMFDGQIVNVIDTPGLFEFTKPENFGREIVKCIDLAKDGIHAIVVVFSLTTCFSQEEAAVIYCLESLFGSKALNYMIVVFTGGDDLERNEQTLEEYFAHGHPMLLEETISRCGNRVVTFNNRTNDAAKKFEQVRKLLSLVNIVIDDNGGKPFTDELFIELKNEALKIRDKKSLRDSMVGYFKSKNDLESAFHEHIQKVVDLSKIKATANRLEEQLAQEQAKRLKLEEKFCGFEKLERENFQELRVILDDIQKNIIRELMEKLEITEREIEDSQWRRRRWRSRSSNSITPLIINQSSTLTVNNQTDSNSNPGPGQIIPVYKPTPPNRPLRTPHSGFHYDGSPRKFFEGWYFKVAIPECRQSFCFMYAVDNPMFRNELSAFEIAQHGPRNTGVGAQILGADDKYCCQYSFDSNNFWGSRHELMLGHTFIPEKNARPPKNEVPPQEFNKRVSEGFQVTPLWHQGFIRDDGRADFAEIVKTARWEYSTRPVYGWGDVGSKQKSTAGWLAAFPVFEPHWQICMAAGLSTGWIEWGGERFEFQDAPSYSEKNWGGAFPRKWYWVQCNVFEGVTGEVALTAAGGLRQLPGLTDTFENAALIGVHYNGIFHEFVPWNGVLNWEVKPWGYWYMAAENATHLVELEAKTNDPGTPLRAPTSEAGFAPACRDTCFGELRLQMWERRSDGSKGKVILDTTSNMAALEVGGGPWFNTWKGYTSSPEILKRALRVPVDIGGIYDFVPPFFRPPGL
ncbi:hypothetical protein ACFE04_017078 [Oxalis oulophora]